MDMAYFISSEYLHKKSTEPRSVQLNANKASISKPTPTLLEALDSAYEDIAKSATDPNTLFSQNMKKMFEEQAAILGR